jgi:hypothetical protein
VRPQEVDGDEVLEPLLRPCARLAALPVAHAAIPTLRDVAPEGGDVDAVGHDLNAVSGEVRRDVVVARPPLVHPPSALSPDAITPPPAERRRPYRRPLEPGLDIHGMPPPLVDLVG